MPKLVNALGADDRYNLILSIMGYLLRHRSAHIDDLAAHFKTTREHIRNGLSSIVVGGYLESNGFENLPFNFDWEYFEETGVIELLDDDIVTDVPRISQAQTAALATGLVHLRSLPEFQNDGELAKLIEMFGQEQISPSVPIIDIKPGTVDEATAKVLQAINARRSIKIDYTNLAGEESTRVIDPIKLIDSDGHPAVLSWCHNAKAQRNFRIDRMRRIEQLEGPITSEASEMFENIDSLSDNPYNPQETDHDVVIEVSPEAYALVSQFTVVAEPKKAGEFKIRATIKVGRLETLGRLIARYGGAATVIEPKIARDIVRDYALAALGQDPLTQANIGIE